MLGFVPVAIDSARRFGCLSLAVAVCAIATVSSQQPLLPVPARFHYGAFTLKLDRGGVITLEAEGWPTHSGT
jgi:hypothetical protein